MLTVVVVRGPTTADCGGGGVRSEGTLTLIRAVQSKLGKFIVCTDCRTDSSWSL